MMYVYAENSQKVGLLITKQQTISQSQPLEVESYAELRATVLFIKMYLFCEDHAQRISIYISNAYGLV